MVRVVPFAVQGGFDNYEDHEEEENGVFEEVDGEVPPLRTLPACVARVKKGDHVA